MTGGAAWAMGIKGRARLRVLAVLAVLALVAALAVNFFGQMRDDKTALHLESELRVLETAYDAALMMYRMTTEAYFQETVDKAHMRAVIQRLQQSEGDARDIARGQLYRQLYPLFSDLRDRKLRQMNVFSPEGVSLLRMHDPRFFDDDLSVLRPMLREVALKGRPMVAFEAGRLLTGLRYIYPLYDEGQLLALVEMGLPFKALRDALEELEPRGEYAFVVSAEVVREILLPELAYLYGPSPLHPDFLIEDPGVTLPDSIPPLTVGAEEAQRQAARLAETVAALEAGRAISVVVGTSVGDKAVSLLPMRDVQDRLVGYMMVFSPAPFAATLAFEYKVAVTLVLILMAALALFYLWLDRSLVRLASEGEKLHSVTTNMADGLYLTDASGHISMANPAAERLLEYPAAVLKGQSAHDLLHSHPENDALDHDHCPIQSALARGEPYRGEQTFRRASGEYFEVEIASAPLRREGVDVGAVNVFRDVTERKRNEAYQRMAARVFESSGEAILVTDADGHIVMVNQAFTEVTGYKAEEVLGRNPRLLSSGRHDSMFYEALWTRIAEQGSWRGEIWNRRKNGEVYPEWLTISRVRDESGEVVNYVAVFADLTEHKAAEARIRHLVEHDSLTGLPNRTLLVDRIEQGIARARGEGELLGVAMLDLDRFKTVNDSLGPAMGDLLIREVAERIQRVMGEECTVSRTGGDEFVILLEGMVEVLEMADEVRRLLDALTVPFVIEGQELRLSASAGISVYPDDGGDSDTLLRNADTAMYQTKEDERGGYSFFQSRMNERALQRLNLENELRRGIERGEMVLHYQPKVKMSGRELCGYEALIRWQHPERGLLSPFHFIGLAEETGLILPMGRWVIEEACRQLASWREAGRDPLPVAVNVSMRQFAQGDLPAFIREQLERHDLPASLLEVELTESLMMDNAQENLVQLNALRELGCRIYIDDFGTGYSSLVYLKRMPIDAIKIDQGFIRDVTDDADDAAIAATMISMAHSLNIRVVAEGVETEAHWDFLAGHGCDAIQGYLISKPMAAEEVLYEAGHG